MLFVSFGFAQNYLLDDGQSSFHIKIKYTKLMSHFGHLVIEPGYTIKGKMTLYLNNKFLIDGLYPGDNKSFFTGAGIDYMLLKQSSFPLSVSTGISYNLSLYEFSDAFEQTSSGYIQYHECDFYAKVFHKISLSKDFAIIPSINIGINHVISIYPENYPFNDQAFALDPTKIKYSLQGDFVFRSLYVIVRSDIYSEGLRKPLSRLYHHVSIGIGILFK